MVNAAYYRRQADLCLQLSLAHADPRVAVWLVELAEELKAKAGDTASSTAPMPAHRAEPKESAHRTEPKEMPRPRNSSRARQRQAVN
jgi:hypothetical protein